MEIDKMNEAWFALQVRARHESLAATHLNGKGYQCFLPLQKSRRQWSDRSKDLEQPLFPGYIFCRFDPLHRLPILVTPGVALIVGVAKIPAPIDEAEIAAIEAAVKSGLPSQPWPFLQIGQRVRIDQGPLCGVQGILHEIRSRHHLILSVTLLRRSIALHIEGTWVTALSSSTEARALGTKFLATSPSL